MGMLDQLVPFSENFKEGETFSLQDAKIGPEINTDYGVSAPVLLKIGGKWYSLFGMGLTNQVERMDNDDRTAMRQGSFNVKVARQRTRSGQEVKLLVPGETPTDDNGFVSDDIPF